MSNNSKQSYDFEFTHCYDPLVYNAEHNVKEVKAEPILIKQESDEIIDFDDRSNPDSDNDEKPLSKVFTDCIKVKRQNVTIDEKKMPKKKKSMIRDKKTLKENISKSTYSNSNKEHLKIDNKKIILKEEPKKDSLNEECLKVNKKEHSKEVLKEKFDKIMFTEDEMLKCREEKRNQANFKKIPFKCSSCVTGFFKIEKYDLHLKKIHNEVRQLIKEY